MTNPPPPGPYNPPPQGQPSGGPSPYGQQPPPPPGGPGPYGQQPPQQPYGQQPYGHGAGQPPYGGGPQTPPKKKFPIWIPIVIAVVVIALIVVIVALVSGGDKNGGGTVTTAPTTTAPADPGTTDGGDATDPADPATEPGGDSGAGAAGSPVAFTLDDASGELSVIQFEWHDGDGIPPDAGNRYLAVEVSVTATDGFLVYGATNFAVKDAAGTLYDWAPFATTDAHEDMFVELLSKNETATGWVGFELPEGPVTLVVLDEAELPIAELPMS